jgi:hypothetical protein
VQQDHVWQHNDAGGSRGEEWRSWMPRERQRRPGRERPGRGQSFETVAEQRLAAAASLVPVENVRYQSTAALTRTGLVACRCGAHMVVERA